MTRAVFVIALLTLTAGLVSSLAAMVADHL